MAAVVAIVVNWPSQRQSPRTVETSVVVMLNGWLVLWCPRLWWGRLGLPAFPV
jgi:hypothetical protein